MSSRTRPTVPKDYDPDDHPRVFVTVDIVVLTIRDERLHVLLIERGEDPWLGAWALPGGFIRPDETLEEAAARELREEAGVDARAYLEQIGAYGDPGRDPRSRVVTVAYLAVLPEVGAVRAGTDARRAEIVPVDEILGPKPARALAFDHDMILIEAVTRARDKLSTTSLATAFVGPEFTLGQLRQVYEAAWGVDLDPGNFRRKVLSTPGFVESTGNFAVPGPEGGKPAETFRSLGRARLHPPFQPPQAEEQLSLVGASPAAVLDPGLSRATLWRVGIGEEAAFQRTLLDGNLLVLVAAGESPISDEELKTFRAGMQVGDWVLAPIARGRVAVGEVRSAVQERPKARDRRLREVREVEWIAELPRKKLPDDIRSRLDAPGLLGPIRVSAGARRIRLLVDR